MEATENPYEEIARLKAELAEARGLIRDPDALAMQAGRWLDSTGSFLVVRDWMRVELGLKGSDLFTFAVVFGFTKHGAPFVGGVEWLEGVVGFSRRSLMSSLSALQAAGLVRATRNPLNRRKNLYQVDLPVTRDRVERARARMGQDALAGACEGQQGLFPEPERPLEPLPATGSQVAATGLGLVGDDTNADPHGADGAGAGTAAATPDGDARPKAPGLFEEDPELMAALAEDGIKVMSPVTSERESRHDAEVPHVVENSAPKTENRTNDWCKNCTEQMIGAKTAPVLVQKLHQCNNLLSNINRKIKTDDDDSARARARDGANVENSASPKKPCRPGTPTIAEVRSRAEAEGWHFDVDEFFRALDGAGWRDQEGRPIRDWVRVARAWEDSHDDWRRRHARPRPRVRERTQEPHRASPPSDRRRAASGAGSANAGTPSDPAPSGRRRAVPPRHVTGQGINCTFYTLIDPFGPVTNAGDDWDPSAPGLPEGFRARLPCVDGIHVLYVPDDVVDARSWAEAKALESPAWEVAPEVLDGLGDEP